MTALVEVRNLVKQFRMRRFRLLPGENVEIVRAVRGVSFQVERGEVLGLVGESGSGKTTVGRTILGLEPPTSGSVLFKGQPAPVGSKSYLPLRRQIQMIFQDSYGSMDPRMAIGDIIEEPLRLLTGLTAPERCVEVRAILHEVGLNEEFLGRFRHQLSGGQQQRVNIARALVLHPEFMVLDEPVSSLDASIRSQVILLLRTLKGRFDLSYLFISHDLQTIRAICSRVAIMRKGRVVEMGGVQQIFASPIHPYTRMLLSSSLIPGVAAPPRTGLLRPQMPELPDDSEEIPLAEVEAGHYVVAVPALT